MESIFSGPVALVPGGVTDGDLQIVSTGGLSGEPRDVEVEVRVDNEDPYIIRTMIREGARPLLRGVGVSLDGTLRDAASTGVGALLLSRMPVSTATADIPVVSEDSVTRATQLGDQVLNHDVWSPGRLEVDGTTFALFYLTVPEGFVVAADLGPCYVVAYGATPPTTWRWTFRPLAELPSSLER